MIPAHPSGPGVGPFVLFLALTAFLSGLPGLVRASAGPEKNPDYFVIKGGVYFPSEQFGLNNFTSTGSRSRLEARNGFNGEVAYGHYFSPLLGIELGAGYFESKASPAIEPGETRLRVAPLQLSGKLFRRVGHLEPYGQLGIGAYVSRLEVSGNAGIFTGSTRITLGLHGGVGLNFNFTDAFFVGLEGRYLQARPEFGGQPLRLKGYTATLNLGFRY